jgi:methionyl aminopeptidase
MSLIKTPQEISTIKTAGKYLGEVLARAERSVKPGLNLLELDASIHKHIVELGAKPSFLGYEDFPNASCLSVNDELVHGIPKDRALKEGDIVGIDVGLWYKGLCVDSAITVAVGSISPEAQRLLTVTQEALTKGIKAIKPFQRIGLISHAVQVVGEDAGLGIVRSLTGHGVGHEVHEEPSIPNIGRPSDGILLRPGMVLAIEPMFTLGHGAVVTDIDGWTIRTQDGSLSAQFEHTVVVTSRGAEIVTTRPLHQAK